MLISSSRKTRRRSDGPAKSRCKALRRSHDLTPRSKVPTSVAVSEAGCVLEVESGSGSSQNGVQARLMNGLLGSQRLARASREQG